MIELSNCQVTMEYTSQKTSNFKLMEEQQMVTTKEMTSNRC